MSKAGLWLRQTCADVINQMLRRKPSAALWPDQAVASIIKWSTAWVSWHCVCLAYMAVSFATAWGRPGQVKSLTSDVVWWYRLRNVTSVRA